MAYPTCKIKNISGSTKVLKGKSFDDDEVFQIPDIDRVSWAQDDDVGDEINGDTFMIHDSEGAINGHMAQIAHLQDY